MISMRNGHKSIRQDSAWLLPILAILGSALSMLAIVILLTHFNNQPIFDWNGVTLNAIVAVFSAMSKAMLAYALSECLGQAKWIWFSSQQRPLSDIDLIDSGSRGPLGSFQILTQPVARSFISMGAIIVILSATMDPFVQLTVGKEDVLKFRNSTFTQIAYAKRYNKELIEATGDPAMIPEADLGMQTAVLEGLTQSDSWISQQTQHSCPSGNCTWDIFTSLAICSRCHDITNQIKKIEKTYQHLERSYRKNTYRLPNHLFGGGANIPMTVYGTANRTLSVSFHSFDTLIWSMTIMNYTMKEEQATSGNFSAMECALWFCVNSYKSAVTNGTLTEIIQPVLSKRNIDSWQPLKSNSKDSEVYVGIFAVPPEFTHATTEFNITEDNFMSDRRRTELQLGDGFNVSQGAFYSIVNLLGDTLTDRFTKTGGGNALVKRAHDGAPNEYSPPAMQSLYNSQDLAATFATLAKSMTNNIRRNDDSHTVVDGKEGHYVILTRVRGLFLTLPVILIVGGAVFFVVVLHYTQRFKMEFWGTNALPIVALGGTMGLVFDENDMRASVMERTAKRQLVQYSTLQARPDFDRVDTLSRSENHSEKHGMVSSLHTSATQSPSANPESIISPTRPMVIQSPQADMEGVVSPIRISEIQNSPADVVSIASPTRISIIQGPSIDAVSVVSNYT